MRAKARWVAGASQAVGEETSGIAAIPGSLSMLGIEGAVVSIDTLRDTSAMGCQKAIAGLIVGVKADYVLALRGNHKDLCADDGAA